jgi:hypothetical protein
MATLNVTSKSFIRPFSAGIRTREYKEEASQTFKKGAILVQDATAKDECEEAGSDPTARILGVSMDDASGTADTKILVSLAEPGAEFVGHVQDGGTLAASNLGTNYGLVYDATNTIWRVDLSDTSNVNVVVTGFVDEIGDVNGRVRFQFLAAARGIYKG